MDYIDFLFPVLIFGSVLFFGSRLEKRKVRAAFSEYIDFYLEQHDLTLERYKVLFLSTGNFKLPWYEVFGPMTPMGKSKGWIFIDLFVMDRNNVKKTITCRVKSEGFYIVDAEFRD